MDKKITRRTLLRDSAYAAIGTSLYFSLPQYVFARPNKANLTKVILIRDENVLNEGTYNKAVLEQMLDKALTALTGTSDTEKAWQKILQPEDILGIKTNRWSNLRTPEELEEVLVEKAKHAGLEPENIAVADHGVLQNPVFERATALINVRPMRTHAWAGVGSLLKNYILFDPVPSSYHDDSCADLAKLWTLPIVAGRTRLNILLMLNPLFHGIGPHHFNRQYTWEYKGILVGFDPVAVDSVGLRIIQTKRLEYFGEETPLNPPAKHIMLADTRHHLGTADPEKIDLVKLGWNKDLLI